MNQRTFGMRVLPTLMVLAVANGARAGHIQGEIVFDVAFDHVDRDTDGAGNSPDPYILVYVVPAPGGGPVAAAKTGTEGGEDVCTNPFSTRNINVCYDAHTPPAWVFWYVYDADPGNDHLMTSGNGPVGPPCYMSQGPDYTIQLCLKQVLEPCSDITYVQRSLPDNAQPGATLGVGLTLHVKTPAPTSLTLEEHIPTGFTYQAGSATPPVTVSSISDNEGLSITVLTWTFNNPLAGTMINLQYNVMAPSLEFEIDETFGGRIIEDGVETASGASDNDVSIGPAQDCNNNGVLDALDITGGVSIDADGNGFPDSCSFELPAVSSWGMGVIVILLVGGGVFVFFSKRRPCAKGHK